MISAVGIVASYLNNLDTEDCKLKPVGAAILTLVSHLPRGDWRIGAPLYFCAALRAAALLLAVSHFRSERRERAAVAAG